jgi:ribosome recycling factor
MRSVGMRAVEGRRSPRLAAWRVTLADVIEETLLDAMDKMDKAVEHVQSQFSTVRTGRAAPALVERLLVDYYGAPVPLQQLASVQVPEARMLMIKPHDRNALGAVEKGDPRQRSRCVAQQRRRGHPTQLPAAHRGAPQGVRQGRQAHGRGRTRRGPQHPSRRPQAPRGGREGREISQDELERAEKELEKVTHEHVERIDRASSRKEEELLEV